jgi:hypothetical protein
MSETFSYSVTTRLPHEQVWELLTDVTNWPKFADIYLGPIRWLGMPWLPGSSLVGRIKYPVTLDFEYLIKACDAPERIRYLSHSLASGFATERIIRVMRLDAGTLIGIDAYAVGRPVLKIPDGCRGFLRMQSERWLNDCAHFCEQHNSSA